MNPRPVSLIDLLASDAAAQFIVPAWRRGYVWATARGGEVERLWRDLRAQGQSGQKHFCGVILLHATSSPAGGNWEVIDGQQRLATFFLVLLALRDVCEKRGVDCSDLDKLLTAPRTGECRLVLQDGHGQDRAVLNALLKRTADAIKPGLLRESGIHRAYVYLMGRVEEEVPSGSQEFLVAILRDVEVAVQNAEPDERTKNAFAVLDARGREGDVASEKKSESVLTRLDRLTGGGMNRRALLWAGLLVVAGLCLFVIWKSSSAGTVTYCRQFVETCDGPRGILPVSLEQARHRSGTYGVESVNGRIVCLAKIDGAGNPVNDPALHGVPVEKICYDEAGNLDRITFLDRNGHAVLEESYTKMPAGTDGAKRLRIHLTFQGRGVPSGPVSVLRLLNMTARNPEADLDGKSGVTDEVIDYSSEGLPRTIRFQDNGVPARLHHDGVLARSFAYNEAGQIIGITNEGLDRKPVVDRSGVAVTKLGYDEVGDQRDETYLGLNGQPVLNREGYARMSFRYDTWGNKTEIDFLGADGKPVFSKWGFARLTAGYDGRGRPVALAFFGTDGEPVLDSQGIAGETLAYGTDGNIREVLFLGLDGHPVLNRKGYAGEALKYDGQGNVVEITRLGLDGHPVAGADGFARTKLRYNDRNMKAEAAYFDVQDRPVLNATGVAREFFDYDESGRVNEQRYMDADNRPVLNKDGVARLTATYDARGNLIEMQCFGLDEKPVLDRNGVARETYKYDEWDNLVETACFGIDDLPVMDRGGVSVAKFTCDARGNRVESVYFDAKGQPVKNADGVARETLKYDDLGNMIEGAYFDVSGQPTLSLHGFARETLRYDERGRLVEAACFGISGSPIEVGGAQRIVYSYDSAGKVSRIDRYNAAGQLQP